MKHIEAAYTFPRPHRCLRKVQSQVYFIKFNFQLWGKGNATQGKGTNTDLPPLLPPPSKYRIQRMPHWYWYAGGENWLRL